MLNNNFKWHTKPDRYIKLYDLHISLRCWAAIVALPSISIRDNKIVYFLIPFSCLEADTAESSDREHRLLGFFFVFSAFALSSH